MKAAWIAVLAVAIGGTAWGMAPDGDDDKGDGKKADPAKTGDSVSEELRAQRAELDALRAQVEALKAQKAPTPTMSLDGTGVLPAPANQDKQAKPAFPEMVKSKWEMNIYGFVEADFIWDSTQGVMTDGAQNPAQARPRTFARDNGQFTEGARNSRIGLKIGAPEWEGIRASAVIEMDFEGTNGGANGEANGTWKDPTFRFRHAYLTLDNDYVTVTLGQGWELFGWQPYFHPNTVDIQGVPGQIYSRSPKAQFTHKFRGPVDVELGASFSRAPERASDYPDIQAGVKVTDPDWKGVHTIGSTGTAIDAAGIGLSALHRKFSIVDPLTPRTSDSTYGNAAAADLFLPILPPQQGSKAMAISITGEVAYGEGFNDQYSSFNGGFGAGAFAPGVPQIGDQGYVLFQNFRLAPIHWRTDIIGIQWYLPPDGSWWIAANYGSGESNNMDRLSLTQGGPNLKTTNPTTIFHTFQWVNVDLFWDVTPAVRLGLSVDRYETTYLDHVQGRDARVQFSAFYLF